MTSTASRTEHIPRINLRGMASFPARLWRSRRIAGRITLRKLRQDPDTGRWRVFIEDTHSGRHEAHLSPHRDKRKAYEYAIEFAWAWARDHGLVNAHMSDDNSFITVWNRWMEELMIRKTTDKTLRSAGRVISRYMPPSVSAITRQDVIHFIRTRIDENLAPVTIRGNLTVLRSFLRWARAENYIDHDPTMLVRGPSGDPRAGVALSYAEAGELLHCAKRKEVIKKGNFYYRKNPPMYIYWYILISLYTGLRRTNVLTLRWTDIDLHERKITIPPERTKAKRLLLVPIHPALELRLRHHKQFQISNWVLTKNFKTIEAGWRQTIKKAKMPGLKPHDLRHTASTWMHLTMPWNYAEVILGRRIPHVGGVYFHPPFEELRKRIDKMPAIEQDD